MSHAGAHEELPGPVAVIAGGLSHERDISLASGRNIVRELRALGVEAHSYDFDRNLLHTLERDKVVAVLPALHGQFGEDGEIQTLLELIDMPYVGSRSHACRLAFDKASARELLRRDGIPVPGATMDSPAFGITVREVQAVNDGPGRPGGWRRTA